MNAQGEYSLNELAFIHGTDKGSKQIERANLSPKNYAVHYEKRFGYLRHEEFTLVEIGVNSGASIRMWHEFFYNAQIVGVDIRLDSEKLEDLMDTERVHLVSGDQGDFKFLHDFQSYLADFPPVEVVVDDGCHKRFAQANSFVVLFETLDAGGYYVVEDLQADIFNGVENDPLMEAITAETRWDDKDGIIEPPIDWIRFYPRMVMVKKTWPVSL